MENFNINTLAVLVSISLGIAGLIKLLLSAFSIFHVKHKMKEILPLLEICEKTESPNMKTYENKINEYLFEIYYKFKVLHDEINIYTTYIQCNNLTETEAKLLFKGKFFVVDKAKRTMSTAVSKTHTRNNKYNLIQGTFFCLIYMASIAYAVFTPPESNNFLPLLFVFIGILFLVLSGIIFTLYVSPYNWAVQIQKKETK